LGGGEQRVPTHFGCLLVFAKFVFIFQRPARLEDDYPGAVLKEVSPKRDREGRFYAAA
jgi:hypothetical protein